MRCQQEPISQFKGSGPESAASAASASTLAAEDQISGLPSSRAVLTETESVARYLLVDHGDWQVLEIFKLTRQLRNKYTSVMLRQAFQLLGETGVVEIETSPQRRGVAKVSIRRRSWSEIQSDPSAEPKKFLKKIRVGALDWKDKALII